MPILVTDKSNLECPGFVCDHCGKPILTAADGNAEWTYSANIKGPQSGPVFYTHKACCHAFERERGGAWHTNDLDVFLVYLMNGDKLDLDRARKRSALLASL